MSCFLHGHVIAPLQGSQEMCGDSLKRGRRAREAGFFQSLRYFFFELSLVLLLFASVALLLDLTSGLRLGVLEGLLFLLKGQALTFFGGHHFLAKFATQVLLNFS